MARKQRKDLVRRRPSREYRKVCWISAEGTTERDYFSMDVFKDSAYAIKFPKDIHPSRRNPEAVLKRFEKMLREEDFRKGDIAWLVVDVDSYAESELQQLLEWESEDPRHHVAISNPKFELFLALHFANASGCTTSASVDAELKRRMRQYKKRLSPRQFDRDSILAACNRSELRRRNGDSAIPDPGTTDVHKLVRQLIA